MYIRAVEKAYSYTGRGYNEWNAAMAIEFEQSYLTGSRSPEESVEAACKAIDAVLDKISQERQTESC